ncbi:metal ABC transporter substrate-binding protein [Halorientalis halophila]|uniref:metal ABC transporter substrate-binding protein n=1 Tax=Halorientalis halophila TaxID=3108499 RepID=UPI00300B661E
MKRTRRSILTASAAGLGAATAGCLGGFSGEGSTSDGAQTSFHLLYDFAQSVAGEDVPVESIVPFGQHGHGWEPSGQVQRDVYTAALFVYMGEGFQPWADDVVRNMRDDDADVVVTDAWDGVDFLDVDGHGAGEHEHDEEHDAGEHGTEAHEGSDHADHEGGDDGHDHDPGNRDPHFWLDPLRARTAVENVRDGLIEAYPDGESGFRDRADAYLAELEALDDRFAETLDDRSRDAVLVAGHNSFQYLGARYGFEIHALRGLSPDERPSARTVSRAQVFVAEHDVEYVLAPALESSRAAEQLVAETDASEVLEITAIAGLTEEWEERDWGYVDLMERVNLPALERALGAE